MLDRYNIDWEVLPDRAHSMLFDPDWVPPKVLGITPVKGMARNEEESTYRSKAQNIIVLDLRDKAAFETSHVPGSLNLPIDSAEELNPYKDPPTMVRQFKILEKRLSADDPEFGEALNGKVVLTLSYRGHIGRLAMSVLRNREIQAHCVMGGYEKWKECGLWGPWKKARNA